jgi:hypothetical protein
VNRSDAEEYTQALGQVVAGGYRQVALGVRLGVPKALGLSTPQWVEDRLGGYVRMSVPDRREAAAELVNEDGMSKREAAEVIGVGESTVRRDLSAPNGATQPADLAAQEATGDLSAPFGAPDPADVAEADAQLEADSERQVTIFAKEFVNALTGPIRAPLRFTPARVAEVAAVNSDVRNAVVKLLPAIREWVDAVEQALAAGSKIRRVK